MKTFSEQNQKELKTPLPEELQRLSDQIDALPEEYRVKFKPLLQAVITSSRRHRETLVLIREAVSQLRLDMKYLVFDLEATRRERDAYRIQ